MLRTAFAVVAIIVATPLASEPTLTAPVRHIVDPARDWQARFRTYFMDEHCAPPADSDQRMDALDYCFVQSLPRV